MLIQPHHNQAPGQRLARLTTALQRALADYCRKDGALEAAWATGRGDHATLSAASEAAAEALRLAYPACYAAFVAAPDTDATARASSVLAEAEKIMRRSGIAISRPGEVADV